MFSVPILNWERSFFARRRKPSPFGVPHPFHKGKERKLDSFGDEFHVAKPILSDFVLNTSIGSHFSAAEKLLPLETGSPRFPA